MKMLGSNMTMERKTMQRFSAKEYLKIDVANSFGLDKKSWAERIRWFDDNEKDFGQLIYKAEEPAMFFAGISAWEAVKKGEPIGYPISLDATSSGLQILAALTGDLSAAKLCNVINTGNREDAYTNVYKFMINILGEDAKIQREDTKRAIMTSLYGSRAVPKEVFGEGVLYNLFISTMQLLAPAAWELNQTFLDMWNPTALENSWILPDNFHVHVKIVSTMGETVHVFNEPIDTVRKINAPMSEGRSLGANTIHSIDGMIVREMTRRCDYNPEIVQEAYRILVDQPKKPTYPRTDNVKMVETLWHNYQYSGFLSARILDYIDEDSVNVIDVRQDVINLLRSLPEIPFQIIAVHDCFRCLPNHANDMREQYNLQLMLIARSNLLGFLLSQIMGKPIVIGKLHPDFWKQIMDTDYALS
jgi:hypothetical protein